MITERQEEQAALHALGLLEGADRSAFDAKLPSNAELRSLVDSFTESTAALALAAPQVAPPSALKDRILSAAETPATAPGEVIEFSLTRLAPWALAACATFASLWFGYQTLNLRTENLSLRTEREQPRSPTRWRRASSRSARCSPRT